MTDAIKGRILQQQVTITTSATAIPATALVGRTSILIKNTGANTIYLGSSTVTTANGYPLAANESISLELEDVVIMYGIVAANTETVNIIEGV